MLHAFVKLNRKQRGFSYVEMLIATVIVMASLGPAIDALRGAQLAAEAHGSETKLHYLLQGRMEVVLAESFGALVAAAATAGSAANPSSYSDPVTAKDRIVVYLSLYDVANSDGDNNVFSIADPDMDADSNPYTGVGAEIEMAWVQVAIPGTPHVVTSLSKR